MRTYSSDMRENQKTGNSAPLKVLIDFFAYPAPLTNLKQIQTLRLSLLLASELSLYKLCGTTV